MPEELIIAEAFKRGLFPGTKPVRNDTYLVEAENVRIGKDGLENPPTVYNPIDQAVYIASSMLTNGEFSSSAGWTVGAGWYISGGVAVHTPGYTDELYQDSTSQLEPIKSVSWYRIDISLTSTAGSVKVALGSGYTSQALTSGTYSFMVYSGGVSVGTNYNFRIIPTSDFDGSIDYVRVYKRARSSPSYWPHPQLMTTPVGRVYVLDSNGVSVYDSSGPTGSGLYPGTYINADDGSLLTLTDSDYWHFVVLPEAVVACDGKYLIAASEYGWGDSVQPITDILDDSTDWTTANATIADGVLTLNNSGSATYNDWNPSYNVGATIKLWIANVSGTLSVYAGSSLLGTATTTGYHEFTDSSGSGLIKLTTDGSSSCIVSGLSITPKRLGYGFFYGRSDGVYTSVCEFQGRVLLSYNAGSTLPYIGKVVNSGVVWTSVGADDLGALVGTLLHSDLDKDFTDYRGGLGYIELPTDSTILAIKPLQGVVCIYTTSGIYVLSPIVDPVPTFGLTYIGGVIARDRSAVAVSLNRHVILDNQLRLWVLKSDLSLTLLGYQYHLNGAYGLPTMADKYTVVSYESLNDDFYIAGMTTSGAPVWLCYLLSPYGLSRIEVCPNGFVSHTSGKPTSCYSLASEDTINTKYRARVASSVFDMGSRGIKTVDQAQFAMTVTEDDFNVELWYSSKFASREDYPTFAGPTSGFVSLDVSRNGYATAHVSGAEFKIVMSADDFNNWSSLEYVKLGWHKSGKKSLKYFTY